MAYVYPENKLEIVDGSLLPQPALPSDLVLIVERAYSGPSNRLYIVEDLATARQLYGERSPIINLANRAVASRAPNVALFRIGGRAHEYINIFGQDSSLRLTTESIAAADNLKVYVGPEPKNSTRQCVIIYEGDRVLYSNVLGAEVTSRKVVVEGFDKRTNEVTIGTPAEPVAFTKLLGAMGKAGAATAAAKQANVENPDDGVAGEYVVVAIAGIPGFDPLKSDLTSITLKTDSGENVSYKVTKDKANLIINPYVDGVSEKIKPADTVSVSFTIKTEDKEVEEKGIKYIPAKDSINATWTELYEELDQALGELELINTKALLVGDWFNVPNVAHGSKDTNRLDYILATEQDDGTMKYEWSEHRFHYQKQGGAPGETTINIDEADMGLNGQPSILKQYNEVDIVHRLGTMAYSRLGDGNFVNIVVGAKGPANSSAKALTDWIGTTPKRDLNGRIVENGSGLLGHKLMVGDVTYSGGYFATANGYVDGDILVDRTGFPVDLGKHISVVVSQVTSQNLTTQVTSGAAAYAGLVSLLTAGNSTTNALVPSHALMTNMKENKRRELAEAGYVVFLERPRGLVVYSGDVATRDNSDFDYISTAVTIAEVTKLITEVTDPYLGKGTDIIMLTALKAALETALANAQRQGWFLSYKFTIRRDGPNTLLIPFSIEAKDELRRISNVVRLVRSDFSIEL